MNSKQAVAEVMKERGYNNTSLAAKLGYAHPSGISERLRGKQDMRVDVLVKLLEALDCQLVIRSKLNDKKEWLVSEIITEPQQ